MQSDQQTNRLAHERQSGQEMTPNPRTTAPSVYLEERAASHLKVGVVEAVDDVPAQLQELLPLQQDAVEEAEGEEQLAVEERPGAARELGLCDELVQTLHVGLHSLSTHTQLHSYTDTQLHSYTVTPHYGCGGVWVWEWV